jgi:hypothetical protein
MVEPSSIPVLPELSVPDDSLPRDKVLGNDRLILFALLEDIFVWQIELPPQELSPLKFL